MRLNQTSAPSDPKQKPSLAPHFQRPDVLNMILSFLSAREQFALARVDRAIYFMCLSERLALFGITAQTQDLASSAWQWRFFFAATVGEPTLKNKPVDDHKGVFYGRVFREYSGFRKQLLLPATREEQIARLKLAAGFGDLRQIKALVSRLSVDVFQTLESPLSSAPVSVSHLILLSGNLQLVEWLAQHLNLRNNWKKYAKRLLQSAVFSANKELFEWFLKQKFDIGLARFQAATGGNVKLLAWLVEQCGGDVYCVIPEMGVTLMHCAAYGGSIEVMQWCEKQGLAYKHKNLHGHTPFFSAVLAGKLEAAEWIEQRSPGSISECDPEGNGVCFLAVLLESRERVEWLFKQDPSLKEKKNKESQGLAAFLMRVKSTEFLEWIYKNYFSRPEDWQIGAPGVGLECCAIKNASLDVLKWLKVKKLISLSKPELRVTFLHDLIERNDLAIFDWACEQLSIAFTPFTRFELQAQVFSAVEYSKDKVAVLQRLRDLGCDLFVSNENDASLLHWAALYGREECMTWLLEQGLNPQAVDNTHETVAHYAAYNGHLNILDYLVARGYRELLDAKDLAGRDFLACAKLGKHFEAVDQWFKQKQSFLERSLRSFGLS